MRRPKSISEEEMMRSPEEKEVREPENPHKQTGRLEKRKKTQLGTQAVSCDCSLLLCFMGSASATEGVGVYKLAGRQHESQDLGWRMEAQVPQVTKHTALKRCLYLVGNCCTQIMVLDGYGNRHNAQSAHYPCSENLGRS